MYRRKTNSLYGKCLRTALTNEKPWLKSEDLPSYSPFFVNWDLIHGIHNNSNHLIVGRRGLGKTHLLGTFEEFISSGDSDEIAVMISIMDVVKALDSPKSIGDNPAFEARKATKEMFEKFLHVFFDVFLIKITTYLNNKIRVIFPKKEFKEIHDHVNDLLTRLMEAIELGREFPIVRKSRKIKTFSRDKGGGFGANAKIGNENCHPSIRCGLSIESRGKQRMRLNQLLKWKVFFLSISIKCERYC